MASNDRSHIIPKQIFMCYKTKAFVETKSAPLWRTLNPEYTIHCYGDSEIEEFFFTHYSELYVRIFRFIQDPSIKADFWRVCVLYTYGGFYADADILPLVPIDSYFDPSAQFLTCVSFNDSILRRNMNPHIIACAKGDSIMRRTIHAYIDFFINNKPYTYWGWSIVTIFNSIFSELFNTIPLHDGIFGNFQFLREIRDKTDRYKDCCMYKDRKILMNRQTSYNYFNHSFSENKECEREGCSFPRNMDIANNGGKHCCLRCKKNKGHGVLCPGRKI